MALNKRERKLLFSTIVIAVVLGTYFLLVPLIGRWKALGRDVATQRRELAGMRSVVARQGEWTRQYDELRGNFAQTAVRFEQASDVLKKVEEVGANAGIVITARRPLPPVERDVYRELPVQCSIEARTDSLVQFLYALQTAAGFMRVEQLQVTPRADNPSVLKCEIQVRALSGKSGGPRT
jgi:Tfp pilus assembly protein PilO